MVNLNPTSTVDAFSGMDRLWTTVVGQDTAFLLAQANARSLSATKAALAPLGLKVRLYSVLALAVSGQRPTQRELSEFLHLDPSQIVALIDTLESSGLVTRAPGENDRRVNVVVATDAGRDVYQRAREATLVAENERFAGLDDSELGMLKRMLRILAAGARKVD